MLQHTFSLFRSEDFQKTIFIVFGNTGCQKKPHFTFKADYTKYK